MVKKAVKDKPVPVDSPDVRKLGSADLPTAPFPGGRDQAFRIFLDPRVHEAIVKHANADSTVEICGVLVGTLGRDDSGPFVAITESIQGDAAASKFAEVTFTHETWSKINAEMDSRYSNLAIVGWYHTHPDFGIFLSDRDRFIQENFFSGPGQVAYVVDPIRKVEGFFAWSEGKPTIVPHYWVGNRLCDAPPAPDDREHRTGSDVSNHATAAGREIPPIKPVDSSATRLTIYLLCLLAGYLISSLRILWDDWDRKRLIEGVAAHYGLWKGMKPELKGDLEQLKADLTAVGEGIEGLQVDSKSGRTKTGLDLKQKTEKRLKGAIERLDKIAETYALSPEEMIAIEKLIRQKLIELRRLDDDRPRSESRSESDRGKSP
jgi:proteasome lid subunit RPN8/RPN11